MNTPSAPSSCLETDRSFWALRYLDTHTNPLGHSATWFMLEVKLWLLFRSQVCVSFEVSIQNFCGTWGRFPAWLSVRKILSSSYFVFSKRCFFLSEREAADLWVGLRKPPGDCGCPRWSPVVPVPGPRPGKPDYLQHSVCLSAATSILPCLNISYLYVNQILKNIWLFCAFSFVVHHCCRGVLSQEAQIRQWSSGSLSW